MSPLRSNHLLAPLLCTPLATALRFAGRSAALVCALLLGCPSAPDDDDSTDDATPTPPPPWNPEFSAEPFPLEGGQYDSSTRLQLRFNLHSEACGYLVRATNPRGWPRELNTMDGDAVFLTLQSDTDYTLTLDAVDCAGVSIDGPTAPVMASTGREVWRVIGDSDGLAGARRVVSDGAGGFHSFRYGADAPQQLDGRLQLYYGASGRPGVTVAVSAEVGNEEPDSFLGYDSLVGASGLLSPDDGATDLVADVLSGQAVPLADALGGGIRLYFAARGADGASRILHRDAADGWVGVDFHDGPKTVCDAVADYEGDCLPTVAVGVAGDVVAPSPVSSLGQFKLARRTQENWRWDGAPGSFLLATVGADVACDRPASANQAFVVYDGAAWEMQTDAGCPRALPDLEAAMPVHLGTNRWKIYGAQTSDQAGAVGGSPLPFFGPKVVLYANATISGDPDLLEWGDIETRDVARGLDFEWPSATPLTATEEGYLQDFVVVRPTQNPDHQVWYAAATDGTAAPVGIALLLMNP